METGTGKEKVIVNAAEGASTIEVILREGPAPKVIDPKPPVKIDLSGVIGAPVEFLTHRLDQEDQINQKRCHVIVNREDISITLITSENDEYNRGIIKGTLSMHPKFVEFGINESKIWTPTELGMFFKMNRAFFSDLSENMRLVTELMNFTATVNNSIEKSAKENGDRIDKFAQTVYSNLPKAFVLNIPIFKGKPSEILEVETFAQVNGREIAFILISPAANQVMEDIRDKVIDEQIAAIRSLAPDIAIIEE
jgi:hypothetical protein